MQLKSHEANLCKENDEIKNDQIFKELEVEKVVQYWTITKQELSEQQNRCIEMEAKLQRIKTAHIKQVSVRKNLN